MGAKLDLLLHCGSAKCVIVAEHRHSFFSFSSPIALGSRGLIFLFPQSLCRDCIFVHAVRFCCNCCLARPACVLV